MLLRPYERRDEAQVIDLWQQCELTRSWNNPRRDIERKLLVQPELFLVLEEHDRIIGTVMAGYEGHRGWINYVAVAPTHRRQGLARMMMERVEDALTARGCPKINLQVRATNEAALGFYRRMGYDVDAVVSLGKRLIPDAAPMTPEK